MREKDEIELHQGVDSRSRDLRQPPQLDAMTVRDRHRVRREARGAYRDGARGPDSIALRGELLDPRNVLLGMTLAAFDGDHDVCCSRAAADARVNFPLAPSDLAPNPIRRGNHESERTGIFFYPGYELLEVLPIRNMT